MQCRVQGARASDEAEKGDAVHGDGLQGRDPDVTMVWYREQRDSGGVTEAGSHLEGMGADGRGGWQNFRLLYVGSRESTKPPWFLTGWLGT